MFIIVCASTANSSVRVGCATVAQARAKIAELEEAGIGKVRVFTDDGRRLSEAELEAFGEPGEAQALPP